MKKALPFRPASLTSDARRPSRSTVMGTIRVSRPSLFLFPMGTNRTLLNLIGLPHFSSEEELATLIHFDDGRMMSLVRTSFMGRYYREFDLAKPGTDKVRRIMQPGKYLKAVQAWILRNILDKLTPSSAATAYRRGRGLLDGVMPHAYNRYFLTVDIENFFPSIKYYRIVRIFERLGYSNTSAQILGKLCTCRGVLPQGGVTSPALSNLVLNPLDNRISGLTRRNNLVFTRYCDDITLSGNDPAMLRSAYPVLTRIVLDEGFTLNPAKTRFKGPSTSCVVTGLKKNSSLPEFGIGRTKRRQMRAIMYKLRVLGVTSVEYGSEASINGWLHFLSSVDISAWESLSAYWNALATKRPPNGHKTQ